MKMNVAITGHGGFIGSHLYEVLSSDSDILKCEMFDRKKYNLLNVKTLKPFVEDKDVIFHLAGKNRANNQELITVNTVGTLCLMEAIRDYSKNDTKIVFTSSFQVYMPTSEPIHLSESHTLNPLSVYGLSKKFAEEIINRYNQDYGIKSIILRLSNVYGPGCRPYYNSVISTFIDLILKEEKITVDGDGEQARDFIYVKDVVNALLKAKNCQSKTTEIFNICSGNPTTLNQLIEKLEKITKRNVAVEYKSLKESKNFLIGNPSKAQEILRFENKISLEDGLKETVRLFEEVIK